MNFQKKLYITLGLSLFSISSFSYHVPNGFYINGGAFGGMLGVDRLETTDIKNKGTSTADDIKKDSFIDEDKYVGKLLYKGALGYSYKDQPIRFDIAYMESTKFDYTANPLLQKKLQCGKHDQQSQWYWLEYYQKLLHLHE